MTGSGPVAVRCPRVRDRGGEGCERIRFSSAILPPYARRSKSPSSETWGVKYDKAVECLIKDRDALLGFYDFPAEHTGSICARRTSSKAHSPRCVTAPCAPRDVSQTRLRSP
jgi:hypothetical protein